MFLHFPLHVAGGVHDHREGVWIDVLGARCDVEHADHVAGDGVAHGRGGAGVALKADAEVLRREDLRRACDCEHQADPVRAGALLAPDGSRHEVLRFRHPQDARVAAAVEDPSAVVADDDCGIGAGECVTELYLDGSPRLDEQPPDLVV